MGLPRESWLAGIALGVALGAAASQPKPMEKPRRVRMICPLGGLGCE